VDLHGRWSRDGYRICFDSAFEGRRQLYVTDVADIVGG
jgi:Tol biopolymer transport system component